MNYLVMVRNMFNDMHLFFNGKEAIGLEALQDTYQEEPLFLAFISDLPEALKISYNDAMQECYGFYKQHCGRELNEEDWDCIVKEIQKFVRKWDNKWCQNVILALLGILEQEDKERKEISKEKQAPMAA